MLIDISYLFKKYKLDITGILHIGAHTCEELKKYQEIGIPEKNIIWIEGNTDLVKKIKTDFPARQIYNELISNIDDSEVNFIITNNGESSSILELKEHLIEHPHIHEISRESRKTISVDTFIKKYHIDNDLNFVNIDIQGAELLALKGMKKYLEKVDYLYLEVNIKELYEGCGLLKEIDDFLAQYKFSRKEINMTQYGWGDAFYIKENKEIIINLDQLNDETNIIWSIIPKDINNYIKLRQQAEQDKTKSNWKKISQLYEKIIINNEIFNKFDNNMKIFLLNDYFMSGWYKEENYENSSKSAKISGSIIMIKLNKDKILIDLLSKNLYNIKNNLKLINLNFDQFNNCDPNTNGELKFYNRIAEKINIIFDIGCRSDTLFNNFLGEVHYFDPMVSYIIELSNQKMKNKKSFFNSFGLSDQTQESYYYPKYQSFFNRINSCQISDDKNKILLKLKTAKDYIIENKISEIDFAKIDTEGYEFNVLKGFGEYIKNIKIIQFEYGGTFLDNGIKLIEVIKYLQENDFINFSYLSGNELIPINDFTDHYQYCNIVCFNKKNNTDFRLL